jgi:hypothetical protein
MTRRDPRRGTPSHRRKAFLRIGQLTRTTDQTGVLGVGAAEPPVARRPGGPVRRARHRLPPAARPGAATQLPVGVTQLLLARLDSPSTGRQDPSAGVENGSRGVEIAESGPRRQRVSRIGQMTWTTDQTDCTAGASVPLSPGAPVRQALNSASGSLNSCSHDLTPRRPGGKTPRQELRSVQEEWRSPNQGRPGEVADALAHTRSGGAARFSSPCDGVCDPTSLARPAGPSCATMSRWRSRRAPGRWSAC